MGQYYKLTCPETGTHVSPHTLGSFVKAYEQVWSTSQPAALAFLCSAGRGDHPRDLPWAPVGLWAGKMPLMVGDYADDGDLRGRDKLLRQGEASIYGSCTDKPGMLTVSTKAKRQRNIAEAFIPIYERVCNVRAADLNEAGTVMPNANQWGREFFPVVSTPSGWEINLGPEDVEGDREKAREYYERCGAFKVTHWQRNPVRVTVNAFVPKMPVPDLIPSHEDGQGGAMLWVNLDRREFIDPAAMGDIPDLVGVMTGMSARAVLAMLVHHERRGGGDLGNLGPIQAAGRWRGDRIVLLGEAGFKVSRSTHIDQEQVRTQFVDVTRNAEAFIKSQDWFLSEDFLIDDEPRHALTKQENEMMAIGLKALAVREAIKDITNQTPLEVRIVAPSRITVSGVETEAPKEPIILAPTFDVFLNGGKIFLEEEVREKINDLLQTLPVQEINVLVEKKNYGHSAKCIGEYTADADFASNHQMIHAHMLAA